MREQMIDGCESLGAGKTLNHFVATLRLYCGVTYFLCRLSITPGDVRAPGDPLVGVCGEAPRVVGTVRVAAVVLPEVSAANAKKGASTFFFSTKVVSHTRGLTHLHLKLCGRKEWLCGNWESQRWHVTPSGVTFMVPR